MPEPSARPGGVRASDADRERVTAELTAHCVAGRLTVDELDARLGVALTARTTGELAEIMHDLPGAPVPLAPVATEPLALLPDRRPFTRDLGVPAPLESTRRMVTCTIAPALRTHGYEPTTASATGAVFERRRKCAWAVAAAVLFFPLGVLALPLPPRRDEITILLDELDPGNTRFTVHGVAPRRLRKAFAQLTFPMAQHADAFAAVRRSRSIASRIASAVARGVRARQLALRLGHGTHSH